MRELTEIEYTQLTHTGTPLKTIEEMGFSSEDAVWLLWDICTRQEAPLELSDCLMSNLGTSCAHATPSQQMALFQRLLGEETTEYPSYFRVSSAFRFATNIAEVASSALLSRIEEIPPPYGGCVVLMMLQHQKIQEIPPHLVPHVCRIYFQEGWDFRSLLEYNQENLKLLDTQTCNQAMLELMQQHSLEHHHHFPWNSLQSANASELITMIRHQRVHYEPLTELLVRYGTTILDPIFAILQSTPIDPLHPYINERHLLSPYMRVLIKNELPIPEEIDRWIYGAVRWSGRSTQERNVAPWLQAIPAHRSIELLRNAFLADSFTYEDYTPELFGVVEDDEVFHCAIAHIAQHNPDSPYPYVRGFLKGRERAARALNELLDQTQPAHVAAVMANVFAEIRSPESTQGLFKLLQHSSKTAPKQALDLLQDRPQELLEGDGLQNTLLSRKKAVRAMGLQLLQILPPTPERDALITEVLARSKDDTVQQTLQAVMSLSTHSSDEDAPQASPNMLRQAIAFEASIPKEVRDEIQNLSSNWRHSRKEDRPGHLERVGLASVCSCIQYLYDSSFHMWHDAIAHFAETPLAPWLAVYKLTTLRETQDSATQRFFKKGITLFKDKAIEPLCTLALRGNNQILLLELLEQIDPTRSISLYLEALGSTRKTLRDAAQNKLIAIGQDVIPGLVSLLSHHKKAPRLAAANILKQIGNTTILETLQQALAVEKHVDVAAALQDAILTLDPKIQQSLDAPDIEQLEAILLDSQAVALPDFLDIAQLPPLYWNTGEALSPEATLGWLQQLSRETLELPNANARILRNSLDAKSLDEFGRTLHELWLAQQRPQRFTWMLYQLSITASSEGIYSLGLGWFEKPYYLMFAHHGSRLAALHLCTRSLPRTQQELRTVQQRAIQELPPDLQPTALELQDFRQENFFRDYYHSEYQTSDTKQSPYGGYSPTWQLRIAPFPALGELPTSLLPSLIELTFHNEDDLQQKSHIMRQLREQQKQNEAEYKQVLEAFRHNIYPEAKRTDFRRFSVEGWKRIFSQTTYWRLCSPSLLFQTESGQQFLRSPENQPVDEHGNIVTLDPDGFVFLIPPKTLSSEERKVWQDRLDIHKQAWLSAQQPDLCQEDAEDPLQELRALLYQTDGMGGRDNWDIVCTLLDSWPQDETLELALSYIEAHATEHWGDMPRITPKEWVEQLMKPPSFTDQAEQNARQATLEKTRICNRLLISNTTLRVPNIEQLSRYPYLSHFQSFSLFYGQLGQGTDKRLAKEVYFPSLHTFSIQGTRLPKGGLRNLLSAPWTANIEQLALLACGIDWQLLQQILPLPIFQTLQYLDLRGNTIQLPGIQILLTHPAFSSLRTLKLCCDDLTEDGVTWLAQQNPLPQIETLHLQAPQYGYTPMANALEAFATSTLFPNLKRLSIHNETGHYQGPNREWYDRLCQSDTLPAEAIQSLRERYENE